MPANPGFGPYVHLRGDMTQKELGLRIGLSRERVVQLENGRVQWPDVEIFNALAKALTRDGQLVTVADLMRKAGANIPETREEKMQWLTCEISTSLTTRTIVSAMKTSLVPIDAANPTPMKRRSTMRGCLLSASIVGVLAISTTGGI